MRLFHRPAILAGIVLLLLFSALIWLAIDNGDPSVASSASIHATELGGVDPPFGLVSAWVRSLFEAALILGAFSMVVIESMKSLLRFRFHYDALASWLSSGEAPSRQWRWWHRLRRRNEWHDLGTRDQWRPEELFRDRYWPDIVAMPIEHLAAQISTIADTAVASHDTDVLRRLLGDLHGNIPSREEDSASRDSMLRQRLAHLIQRRIDGFQIHVSSAWRHRLRELAIAVSSLLAVLGSLAFGVPLTFPSRGLAFVCVAGLLGGLLAGICRDAIAVVQRWRA